MTTTVTLTTPSLGFLAHSPAISSPAGHNGVRLGTPGLTVHAHSPSITAPANHNGVVIKAPRISFVKTGFEMPGSSWEAAIDIAPYLISVGTELHGSITAHFLTAVPQTDPDEAIVEHGDLDSPRIWYKYTPSIPGELQAWFTNVDGTTTFQVEMDAFTGDTLPSLVDIYDFTRGTFVGSSVMLDIVIGPDTTYYFRGWPFLNTDNHDGLLKVRITQRIAAIALQWTTLNDDGTNTIARTPFNERVNVLNGDANATVSFHLDGDSTVISTGTLNTLGTAIGLPVALPAIAAGHHVLHCVEIAGGTQTGDMAFEVTLPPRTLPAGLGADNSLDVLGDAGSWQFIDMGYTLGRTLGRYVFPNNPDKMTSPLAGKVYSNKTSTAQAGTPLTFEGAMKPAQWQVSGTTLDKTFTQELEKWLHLNKRFVVVDHYGRGWTVSFESYDAVPTKDPTKPWAMKYTLSFIIYAGPVTVTFA